MIDLAGLRGLAPRSPAARFTLRLVDMLTEGLEFTLACAAADDPGVELCGTLLRDLRGEAGAVRPVVAPPPLAPSVTDAALAPAVRSLAERMAADPEIGCWCTQLAQPQAETLWRDLHLALLKMPIPAVRHWSKAWEQGVGRGPRNGPCLILPWDRDEDEEVLPALCGGQGLRLSRTGPIDNDLVRPPGAAAIRLEGLSALVSTFLWLGRHDVQAWQVFRPINGAGPDPTAAKPHWRRAVLDRFSRVCAPDQKDLAQLFRDVLSLDEAVNSLLATPLPDAKSWWSVLQDRVRLNVRDAAEHLRQQPGRTVHWEDLFGRYPDLHGKTEADCRIDARPKAQSNRAIG